MRRFPGCGMWSKNHPTKYTLYRQNSNKLNYIFATLWSSNCFFFFYLCQVWNCKPEPLFYVWDSFHLICTNSAQTTIWVNSGTLDMFNILSLSHTRTPTSCESVSSFPLDLSSYLVFYSASPPTVRDIDCHNKTIILPASLRSSSMYRLNIPVYCLVL